PNSTLTGSSATFQWTAGSGVNYFWLDVGTTSGGHELFSQNKGMNLSGTVSGLPTDGSRIYARIWSCFDSACNTYDFDDVWYTAYNTVTGVRAQMTSPTPSSTLTSSTVTF